jgi:hypothetical protein
MKNLSKKMRESGVDVSKIDLDEAIRVYEEGRKLEWKRLSMIQSAL